MEILRTLLEVSGYSAALFAGIMLFKKLTRGKVSPVLSFALWFLLLARLCVPVTIQSGFHLYALPEAQPKAEMQKEEDNAYAGGGEAAFLLDEPQTIIQTDGGRPAAGTSSSTETATVQSEKPAFVIDIYGVLLLVWLGVMSAILIWIAYIAARVSKVVKKKSVPVSGHIEKIYIACCEETGFKKRLPLLITENLASPALAVSIRPKILLPLRFVQSATDAQIRLALRHEITHYKRKDHLVCILMRVLTAVYWFNPVVWLAEREIISDMETACDNLIVQKMQKAEKTYYANMILSMFARKAEAPFVLGMALSNTRNIAERRIRGIYMKNKTKKGMRTAAVLLSMILLVACFTTACQPGEAAQADAGLPQEEVIFTAAETPARTEEPAEERYQDSVQLADGISVYYDAAVIEPEGPLPVATMEFREFTEADFQKVLDCFFAGEDIYKPWARTKAEVQEEIDGLDRENTEIAAEKDAFLAANPWAVELYEAMDKTSGIESEISDPIKAKYSLTDEDLGEYMDIVAGASSMLAMNNYTIENDSEELESAPDIRKKEPAKIQYANVNMGRVAGVESGQETLTDEDMIYNQLRVWTEGENGNISEVGSTRMEDGRRSSIYYSRKIYPSPYGNVEDTPSLTIPQVEAQKLAEDVVAAICPEMSLKGVMVAQYFDYKTQERQDAYDAYYEFTFTRDINGVPITADSYSIGTIDNETEEVTFYEMIQVMVDDDGILGFSWRTPYDNIRVTQEDAQALSREEAKKAFEENTLKGLQEGRYMEEASEDEYGFGLDLIEIDIDKIQLGLTRVKDEEGGFELVPTWDFFGTATAYRDGEEQRFNRFGQSQGNESMGTVNALDGTPINRSGHISVW